MDLTAKIRTLPTSPAVDPYKSAEGEVIYISCQPRGGHTIGMTSLPFLR